MCHARLKEDAASVCCCVVVVATLLLLTCCGGVNARKVPALLTSNTISLTGIPCGILLREIDIEWSLPLPDTTENTEAEKDGDEDDDDDADDNNNKEGEEKKNKNKQHQHKGIHGKLISLTRESRTITRATTRGASRDDNQQDEGEWRTPS